MAIPQEINLHICHMAIKIHRTFAAVQSHPYGSTLKFYTIKRSREKVNIQIQSSSRVCVLESLIVVLLMHKYNSSNQSQNRIASNC